MPSQIGNSLISHISYLVIKTSAEIYPKGIRVIYKAPAFIQKCIDCANQISFSSSPFPPRYSQFPLKILKSSDGISTRLVSFTPSFGFAPSYTLFYIFHAIISETLQKRVVYNFTALTWLSTENQSFRETFLKNNAFIKVSSTHVLKLNDKVFKYFTIKRPLLRLIKFVCLKWCS